MFNWIRRRLFESRREIFRYWDGTRTRKIDPRMAYRALQAHPKFNPDLHLPGVERGDLDAIDATLAGFRDVFGLTALGDDGGLTVDETLGLAASFLEYLHTLKKSGSPPPISPEPTESESSDPKSETTNVSVAFG